jgi:hypothetical protein
MMSLCRAACARCYERREKRAALMRRVYDARHLICRSTRRYAKICWREPRTYGAAPASCHAFFTPRKTLFFADCLRCRRVVLFRTAMISRHARRVIRRRGATARCAHARVCCHAARRDYHFTRQAAARGAMSPFSPRFADAVYASAAYF